MSPVLTKFVFSFRLTIIKASNTKFHENLSSGIRAVTYGQTEGNDEAKNCSLVGCYAENSGLPALGDNLCVPSSKVKKDS